MSSMKKTDTLAPILLLEGAVVAGRTHQAYKRDGFIEARERFTEEILGSIFWLFGFQMFSALGDKIGKKIFKVDSMDVDIAGDSVRSSLNNFLKKNKINKTKFATFKCAKVVGSILISNAIIGFVVPKVNQALTRHYQKKLKKVGQGHYELMQNAKGIDKFSKNINSKDGKTILNSNVSQNSSQNPSFGNSMRFMFSTANLFENNATAQLLSNDVGIAGGRAANARNKHERLEVLFRDLSSIYFYMFCRSHIDSLFNYLEDGRASRIDPASARLVHEHLANAFDKDGDKKVYTAEEFEKRVFGKSDVVIPQPFESKIANGIFKLNDIEEVAKANPGIISESELDVVRKMSKLQPQHTFAIPNTENFESFDIVTKSQFENALKGGELHNPEFLNKVYSKFIGHKTNLIQTLFSRGKEKPPTRNLNEMAFVSQDTIDGIHNNVKDYVNDIIKKAKSTGEGVSLESLVKARKLNFAKSAFNILAGFGISAYFLSTAIPKIQYWITKTTTGKNSFPGTTEYEDAKKKAKA